MKRRRLLAALGTAASVSAGCLTTDDPIDGPMNVTAMPPTASDTFADRDCPTLDDADRTVCHHTAGASEAVVLSADPDVFDPASDGTLQFTLYNRGDWTVLSNPYDWAIYEFTDGSWTDVTPTGPRAEPLYILEPGDSLAWRLGSDGDDAPDTEYTPVDVSLDAGTYAFGVTGRYDRTNITETPTGEPPEGETGFVALFRLESTLDGGTATGTVTEEPSETSG